MPMKIAAQGGSQCVIAVTVGLYWFSYKRGCHDMVINVIQYALGRVGYIQTGQRVLRQCTVPTRPHSELQYPLLQVLLNLA